MDAQVDKQNNQNTQPYQGNNNQGYQNYNNQEGNNYRVNINSKKIGWL
jgi:hypothetical protein